jgi:hypothetical protein
MSGRDKGTKQFIVYTIFLLIPMAGWLTIELLFDLFGTMGTPNGSFPVLPILFYYTAFPCALAAVALWTIRLVVWLVSTVKRRAIDETVVIHESSEQRSPVASRFSTKALLNSGLRSLVTLSICVELPLLTRKFKVMFEEYGVELPALAQIVLTISDRAYFLFFLFIPFVILASITVELGILAMPRGTSRTILNLFTWFVLVMAIITYGLGMMSPAIEALA